MNDNVLMSLIITQEEINKAKSVERFANVENLIEVRVTIDGIQKDMSFAEFKNRLLNN